MEPTELSNEEMILSFLAEGGDEFVSGAALSDKLGLSRTAVWKHVERLRELGYRIDAQPARGYRLVEVPDRLTALELLPLLATRELGRTVHHFESTESTNRVAFELAQDGAFHGEVVIAEAQTAGKGRRGRSWSSPPGKNLYCSVILRPEIPPARAPELTLVAAVALAETLREAGGDAGIKWPNDVQLGGRKVAGILTELSADAERVHFVVVGLGVNLNATADDFPPELAEVATSLKLARGTEVPRALFTAALLTRLEQWFDTWAEEGFAPVRAAWKKLSTILGREVLVRGEQNELRGIAEDIDDGGALLLRVGGTVERVLAGDVEQVRARKS
ncbi:MAG: biotin--[acetyl-CoA-carboxylase] ligase [Myxococcota bacterium]|jgi:BirA family biotin operon repressor/biotin-[acetyl-CoA-carboxylase] ligase